MTAKVKVELGRVRDANVDCRSRRNISGLSALLLLVGAEESRVMSFLDDDEGDAGTVVGLEFDACLADGRQLVLQDVRELAFGDAVAVQDDAVRLVAVGGLVEHHKQLADHAAELLDHLLAVLLDANGGGVARRMRVHGPDHSGDRRLLVVASWWMRDVGAEEDDRLVEDLRADRRNEDRIDAPEFDVDL